MEKVYDSDIYERVCECRLTAFGTSRHSAFPEGSVNAVHELAAAVCRCGLLKERDQKLMQVIADATSDYHGESIGIAFSDEISGPTTCAGTMLTLRDRHVQLTFNIRYSITD